MVPPRLARKMSVMSVEPPARGAPGGTAAERVHRPGSRRLGGVEATGASPGVAPSLQGAAQRMRAQVQQEVRGRLDQVRWGERQAERWRVVEWGWWLVQRQAVRVGGSRRSAAGRGGTLWATAASAAAALRRKGQAGEREGSAPAGLCRRQVRAAGAGRGRGPRYWRLGGGGKQGWVK